MNAFYLIAAMGGEQVAFRAAEVLCVFELGTVTPAPRAPAFIAGLAAMRSRPLIVIDCAASLETGRAGRDVSGSKAVVAEIGGHLYALAVDSVDDVIEASAELEPVPALLAPGWHRVARGMFATGSGAYLAVDCAALAAGPDRPGRHKPLLRELLSQAGLNVGVEDNENLPDRR